jgi:RNA polymerase sigma-70 factor (ECF subfamily)
MPIRGGKVKTGIMAEANVQEEEKALVAELFEQYHEAIFAYLYRLMNDREWAHDLTQDVFLQLFHHRQSLRSLQNERAWIYRVATNLAFNVLKRRKRFTWLPWQQEDGAHVQTAGPAESVGERAAVEAALAQLPPNYRAPLLLYSRYGFSVREVALALEISEGAVKNRLYRAREMFRQHYDGGDGRGDGRGDGL